MQPGKPEAREFEYQRHGIQTVDRPLRGRYRAILSPSIGPTRAEEDFVAHIRAMIDTDPSASWIFIGDQLNTHKSAGLVEAVASWCGIEQDLGEKGKSGILHSVASRAAFYRIRAIGFAFSKRKTVRTLLYAKCRTMLVTAVRTDCRFDSRNTPRGGEWPGA